MTCHHAPDNTRSLCAAWKPPSSPSTSSHQGDSGGHGFHPRSPGSLASLARQREDSSRQDLRHSHGYAYTSSDKDSDSGRRLVHGGRELATPGWSLRVAGGGFNDSGLSGWLSRRPRLPVGGPNLLRCRVGYVRVLQRNSTSLPHLLLPPIPWGVVRDAKECRGRGQGNSRGTTRGGARRRDRIRDALGGGVHSRDLLSSGPAALRRTPIRHRFRTRIADALLMALPLLPDRGVRHGALHLPRGGRNACPAGLACSGWIRGCTTDVLAFSPPSSGRLGGSGMGGGGLGSDADRGQPGP